MFILTTFLFSELQLCWKTRNDFIGLVTLYDTQNYRGTIYRIIQKNVKYIKDVPLETTQHWLLCFWITLYYAINFKMLHIVFFTQ